MRTSQPRLALFLPFGYFIPIAVSAGTLAGTLYVNANATPGGDGSSWATAFADVGRAAAAAKAGDEIWCRSGTYELAETIGFASGVTVRGGFAAMDASAASREHVLASNRTVLRQSLAGRSVIALQDVHGVTPDGLTLTGAVGASGLRLSGCGQSVSVRPCSVELNRANTSGAGVTVLDHSQPAFIGCKVADNATTGDRVDGAGIYVDATSGSPWTFCVISTNVASGRRAGGALLGSHADLVNRFDGGDFYFNESGENGSALAAEGNVELHDSVICSNRTRRAAPGAAIAAGGAATAITLNGKTSVIGHVAGAAGAEYAPAIDGEAHCKLSAEALAPAQTGMAGLTAKLSVANDGGTAVSYLNYTTGVPGWTVLGTDAFTGGSRYSRTNEKDQRLSASGCGEIRAAVEATLPSFIIGSTHRSRP